MHILDLTPRALTGVGRLSIKPPGSSRHMQHIVNSTGESVENRNKESMKTTRKDLYAENEMCGFAGADVRVEAEGRYNNPFCRRIGNLQLRYKSFY